MSRDAGQRSRLREQLTSPRAIDAAMRVRAIQRETESRARLVCDRMERDERFAHPPVVPGDQALQWIRDADAKHGWIAWYEIVEIRYLRREVEALLKR